MSTGLYINNNSAANGIQANLLKSQANLGKVYQQVSTGLRVNSAKDDAAGFANVQRMTTQIRGLDQARKNTADGLSMAAIADGAVAELTDTLQRMRELALDASNGTRTSDDKDMIQAEMTTLIQEVDRISKGTKFGEQPLLDATAAAAPMRIQIGAGSDESVSITMVDASSKALGIDGLDVTKITDDTTLKAVTDLIDTGLKDLNKFSADLGASQKRFETIIGSLATQSANMQDARGRIQDADMAQASGQMAKFNVQQQTGISMLAQANQIPQAALQLLR